MGEVPPTKMQGGPDRPTTGPPARYLFIEIMLRVETAATPGFRQTICCWTRTLDPPIGPPST